MKRALCLAALALVMLVPGLVSAKGLHADFPDLDKNGDGKVTYEEFKATFPSTGMKDFKEANASGSGTITEEEWKAYMNKAGMEDHGKSGHGK